MKKLYSKFNMLMLTLFVSLITVFPALAAPTVDDIWTAGDISGISAKLIPMAILIVGIALVGVGLGLVVKGVKKARTAF